MPYLNLTNNSKVRPMRIIFIFYWFLLAYILAALIFWFLALTRQNNELTQLRLHEVNIHETHFIEKVTRIENEKKRKTAQYFGEGIAFLFIILAGAWYSFRIINKQLSQAEKQRNFMLAITHELKTPVAVTKLNLETMKIRKLDFSQQQKLIKSTIEEANRLDNLCNNMLFMSQLDSGGPTLTKERFDLPSLVDNCVEDFMLRFPEREIEFSATEEIIITGDKLLLQLAINNLLDNAIKYSGKEDVVLVKVFKQNK
ncbi:MAG: histidine kinase dimerization/phospho-acceptor domain-containing protein, partial [Ginsengibacter sp.]